MADAGCLAFYGQKTEPMAGYGKFSEWDKHDIIQRLMPLLSSGWVIDAGTNKIRPILHGYTTHSPWWHWKTAASKKCTLWHKIMFNHWGFVPSGCQECWKTVVRPRTLKELFALRKVQETVDLPAKCGIEVRSYTPAHYGGYFYANSLDEGRNQYKTVRQAVSDMISPDVGVILKRGCTEMELQNGPSAFWKLAPEQLVLEKYIEDRVSAEAWLEVGYPDYLIERLKKRWVHWAFSNNDATYLDYTGGRTLHTPPVTYHEAESIDDIKRDLQVARCIGSGVKPAAAAAAHDKIVEALNELRLTPAQAGALLGYSNKNPLYDGCDVAPELVGEEDLTS